MEIMHRYLLFVIVLVWFFVNLFGVFVSVGIFFFCLGLFFVAGILCFVGWVGVIFRYIVGISEYGVETN